MQQKLNLLLARTNRLALQLSIKESHINEDLIDNDKDPIYYFMLNNQKHYFNFNLDEQAEQKRQEYRLGDVAIKMAEKGMHLRSLYWKRNKLLIEEALVKRSESDQDDYVSQNIPLESLKQLDFQENNNKNKIKQMVIQTYRKNPQGLKEISHSLNLSSQRVRLWVKQDDKRRKRQLLREEVFQKGLQQKISLTEFKSIARRIYKSKLFRATDAWCCNFIVKYNLTHVVMIEDDQKQVEQIVEEQE